MSRRRIGIVAAVIAGAVVVLNLLATGLDRAVGGSEPEGAPSSSYATTDDGLAAYASLLSHYNYDVSQLRGPIGGHLLPAGETVVVIEPKVLTDDDAAELLDFVVAGGRLVVGGRDPFYLKHLRDRPPAWSADGTDVWSEIDPSLGDVRRIDAAGEGSWASLGTSTALVREGDRALVTVDHAGDGEIVFLADVSPLQNAYLSRADNAAFALALAGDTPRPVVFAEGVHGYGESSGFAAIPTRWRYALAVFAIAAIVFLWSRARRFGPPDREARELPPARAEYVRALSTTLARTRQPAGAFAPMQRWARDVVATRAALAVDASGEDVVRAAKTLGCTDAEADALVTPIADDEQARVLGSALARVSEDGRARERTP